MIVIALEAARRSVSQFLSLTSLAFLLYAFFGPWMPGLFIHKGYSIERVVRQLYVVPEGIYGIPMGISATFIAVFVLFGAFLEQFGAGKFFIEISYALAGRYRGGPAKTAVISSALMGTISGSPVANVVTTGTFTIPLMIRTGYTRVYAGAIEACASTGGMFTPPVMGAAAFIMAEYLEIGYGSVALSASLPAFLYYLCLMLLVDAEAQKLGLKGLPASDLPSLWPTLKDGAHHLLPLAVIIAYIFQGHSPMQAAFMAILMVTVLAFLRSSERIRVSQFFVALERGADAAVPIAAACAAAGIIVGMISLTGLGSTLSTMLVSFSGGSKFAALVLVMLVAIILGCGMPPAAVYIIMAALTVPSLTRLGFEPLSAHFFAFYFSCVGAITPPVALASYAAAGISGASPVQTGVAAFRMGLIAFIIPFMFAYSPALLGKGTPMEVIVAFTTAIAGVLCFSVAVHGHWRRPLSFSSRVLFVLAALALLKPGIWTDLIGIALAAAGLILHKCFERREPSRAGAE